MLAMTALNRFIVVAIICQGGSRTTPTDDGDDDMGGLQTAPTDDADDMGIRALPTITAPDAGADAVDSPRRRRYRRATV